MDGTGGVKKITLDGRAGDAYDVEMVERVPPSFDLS